MGDSFDLPLVFLLAIHPAAMANRARGNGASYTPSNNPPRQNEYFLLRDGIDREVITADICRYLGNDALVRPGTHVDVSRRVNSRVDGTGRGIGSTY